MAILGCLSLFRITMLASFEVGIKTSRLTILFSAVFQNSNGDHYIRTTLTLIQAYHFWKIRF